MKITKRQLKKIIREEIEVVTAKAIPIQHHDKHGKKDGEVGMAINQLQAISATAIELGELIRDMDYVPEWGDGKIATVLDRLNSVRSYMLGKSVGQIKKGYDSMLGESMYDSNPIQSAYDSGMADAREGMEPESYHDWIAENPELMDAYDAGYEEGLSNPAPKSKMSNAEFNRIYGDMDVGVRGKAGY